MCRLFLTVDINTVYGGSLDINKWEERSARARETEYETAESHCLSELFHKVESAYIWIWFSV